MRDAPNVEAARAEVLQLIKECLSTHPWVFQKGGWRRKLAEEEAEQARRLVAHRLEGSPARDFVLEQIEPKMKPGHPHEDFLPRDLFLTSLVERALAHGFPPVRYPTLKKGAPCAAEVVAKALKKAGLSGPNIDRIEDIWTEHNNHLDDEWVAARVQLTGLSRLLYVRPRHAPRLSGEGAMVASAEIPRDEET